MSHVASPFLIPLTQQIKEFSQSLALLSFFPSELLKFFLHYTYREANRPQIQFVKVRCWMYAIGFSFCIRCHTRS